MELASSLNAPPATLGCSSIYVREQVLLDLRFSPGNGEVYNL
ncbi:MAG: hypothetical protein VYA34_08120 [Myxococcota bacterium]|nr:hypothetical protein [Myxococcota bacterium]